MAKREMFVAMPESLSKERENFGYRKQLEILMKVLDPTVREDGKIGRYAIPTLRDLGKVIKELKQKINETS